MLELPQKNSWLYKQFFEHGFHSVRRSDRYWAGLSTDLVIEQVMMRSIKSRGRLTRGRGFTEAVRLMWVYSMHSCVQVYDAMTSLTGLAHRTSEQHVELTSARRKRDFDDMAVVFNWVSQHNPFDSSQPELRSLSSGLTASDGDVINCDAVEEIGQSLQKKVDNVNVWECWLKRIMQVRTIVELERGVKIDGEKVYVDPNALFSRLIILLERQEELTPFFKFELTPFPTSLFKCFQMRKTNKAVLKHYLTSDTMFVLDGGALLHRVKWLPKVI